MRRFTFNARGRIRPTVGPCAGSLMVLLISATPLMPGTALRASSATEDHRTSPSAANVSDRSVPPNAIRVSQWTPPPRSDVLYAGLDCGIDGMKSWSVTTRDDNELTFELRAGDRLRNPETGYVDPPTAERSEISVGSKRWLKGDAVFLKYEFLIPSGFDFTSPWTVTAQMHADLNVSPPFEIGFRPGVAMNRLVMTARSGDSRSLVEHEYPIGEGPLPRDVWHEIRLRTKMGRDGFLQAWLDGKPVLDLQGDIGFNDQTNWYWRMGIYRRAVMETYLIHIRNFEMRRL